MRRIGSLHTYEIVYVKITHREGYTGTSKIVFSLTPILKLRGATPKLIGIITCSDKKQQSKRDTRNDKFSTYALVH